MLVRRGFRAIGLAGLATGAIAISTAGVAQAETGACWGYESSGLKCFSGSLEAKPIFALENNTGTLLVANVNLEILCTTAAFVEGGTLSANGSILLGRVEFGGCISLSKTPTLTKLCSCTPKDPVAGLGKIRTEKGTGLIVLHGGEPVLELKPDSGTNLAKIFLGEECAVSEELILTGKLVLQDASGKSGFESHGLSHLIQEFTSLKLMKVGINSAELDGTASMTLESPHNALKWAGKAA